MITRETDSQEQASLRSICLDRVGAVTEADFRNLGLSEAALLPGALEAHGTVVRFQIAPRLTEHVRHRTKYLDMPVTDGQAFVFTSDGRAGPRARSLHDFVQLLEGLPDSTLAPHLQRHDFSRWLEQVFRDCPLATHVRGLENRFTTDSARDVVGAISQAVRARYEMMPVAV